MSNRTKGTKNTLKRWAACMLVMVLLLGTLPAATAFASDRVRGQVSDFIVNVDHNLVLREILELFSWVATVDHNIIRGQVTDLVSVVDMAFLEAFIGVWNSYFAGVAPLPANIGTRGQVIDFISNVDRNFVLRQATDLFSLVSTIDHTVIRNELLSLAAVVPTAYLQDIVTIWNRLF